MFEVDLPGARAVFTTRSGGHSEGAFSSLNLGLESGDRSDVVERNLERLRSELELPRIQLLKQVHGSELRTIEPEHDVARPIADGATIRHRERALLITGADCPTVMIASESRLSALHCGWRPVAAGLIEKATADFATESFDAVIGPGICADHFEVGDEVIEAMGSDGPAHASGRQLDLAGLIQARLSRAGARRVHVIERCTYCEPELFFSHRRDNGTTGRQAGIAWRY